MRIVVTGGAGFIGQRLCARLSRSGYDVVSVDLVDVSCCSHAEHHVLDLRDSSSLGATLAGGEVVVHLAGGVRGDYGSAPLDALANQQVGTLNAVSAAASAGVRRFVVASSFYVYGASQADAVDEDAQLDLLALEAFGASKLMTERLAREASQQHGLQTVSLRFGSVYGPGNASNAVNGFVQAARRIGQLEVWGTGQRRNQFTHVDDVVEGCVAVVVADRVDDVYNLISPEVTTTRELARHIADRFDADVSFKPGSSEPASMPFMSSERAVADLGWTWRTLRAALDELLDPRTAAPAVGS